MADKQDDGINHDEEKNDERFDFIYQYLNHSSKIKIDKWEKMMTIEESKVCTKY